MKKFLTSFVVLTALSGAMVNQAAQLPNIILIYGDDVGYGDFGCYGATSVSTPNVDRLAKEGLRFTSAYCSSATCTPSRYSLLTGEYAFRKKGTGVLPGDAALIIEPGRDTLPSILKQAGYQTGVVGKWHLGLGSKSQPVDWNGEINPGPLETGFDYSFIMAATLDRVPCVYIENHRVVGLDPNDPIQVNYKKPFPGELIGPDVKDRTTLKMDRSHNHNDAIINGIGRIGFMTGGKAAIWVDEDMADVFTRQATDFIDREKAGPFFLYFATSDIHKPHVTHARFSGKTTMGPRGDAIVEFDYCVGEILKKLDELKLTGNTLVILSSDNGPVLDDGYKDDANEKLGDHKPASVFRGGKYSLFEGGTRVPFIVRWPGRVKPGVSDTLISQVDFSASLGALVGQKPDPVTMPDSLNMLPAMLGESATGRDWIVEHSAGLSLRSGQWKYIAPGKVRDGLGPWKMVNVPEPGFLFDLATDPGETQDLAAAYPEKVRELANMLKKISGKNDSKNEPGALEGGLSALGAKIIGCDSQETASPAVNVLDGDPDTIWHTRWKNNADPMPHHLVIDLGRETALGGIRYLPRQHQPQGRCSECQVFCSNNPNLWGEAVASVKWQNNDQWQTLSFEKAVKARYLKILVTSSVNNRPAASIAELDVILAK